MRVAFCGDIILLSQLVNEPEEFSSVRDILKSCDVVFAYFEMTTPSADTYAGKYWQQGCPIASDPQNIDILKECGISGVSLANNHAFDWGTQGLIDTMNALRKKELPFSGAGMDKKSAGKALRLNIKNKSVGMISITARYPEWGIALDGINGFHGKPGVNTIQIRERPLLAIEFGMFGRGISYYSGGSFVPNNYLINEQDLIAAFDSLRQQKEGFDALYVSLHFHQRPENKRISSVLRKVCRSFIKAGANGVFVHGGHRVKGFEVYRDTPVFYGLGNLFFELDKVERQHPEFAANFNKNSYESYNQYIRKTHSFWNQGSIFKSILPVCTYDDSNKLVMVQIYPLDLGLDDETTGGIPRLGKLTDVVNLDLFHSKHSRKVVTAESHIIYQFKGMDTYV